MSGSAKCKVDLPPKLEVDSHWHDWMKFSCPKVVNLMTSVNRSSIVDVGETSDPDFVITHNGVEVLECLCGDDIWQSEWCPPKSNNHCSMLQNKHWMLLQSQNHFKTNISCGILAPFCVGYWFATKGVIIELHEFWFCHDDLLRCVGRTSMKYALNRPVLPSSWLVQARTNLTQIEVVALEEASFLLSEKPKCPLVNHVGNDNSTPMNQPSTRALHNFFGDGLSTHVYMPLDLDVWLKIRNGKKIRHPNTFKLFVLRKNKWEVGWTFEATLLTPSNIFLWDMDGFTTSF